MKNRIIKTLTAALLAALCFTGCAQEMPQSTEKDDKLNIYTSFYCVYDFAQKIAGDKAEITNLIPPGTEPHDWEPTSGDMAALSKCDVLFCSGLNMEGWLDDVKNSVDVHAVVLSDSITDLPSRDDPHIWLDPSLADKMAKGIYGELTALDPENAEYYAQNYNTLAEKFKALDEKYKTELAPYEGKKIVVSHMAYSYLCARYGLEQIAIDGLFADSEPSPVQMKSIIDQIKENNVTTVFYEELLSRKVADMIAEETGAQLLPLNPVEGLDEEEMQAGEDYFTIMEENLENLKTALAE